MESEKHTCLRCHRSLCFSQFWKKSKGKNGLQTACKDCQRELQRARHRHNPELAKAYTDRWLSKPENLQKRRKAQRKWAANNPDWFAAWRLNNSEKVAAAAIKSKANDVALLRDTYVKKALARGEFSIKEIPNSLVEAKRVQIQIKRLLKERKA